MTPRLLIWPLSTHRMLVAHMFILLGFFLCDWVHVKVFSSVDETKVCFNVC